MKSESKLIVVEPLANDGSSISSTASKSDDSQQDGIIIERNESLPAPDRENTPLLKTAEVVTETSIPFSVDTQALIGMFRDGPWALASFYDWKVPGIGKPWNSWANQVLVSSGGLMVGGLSIFALNEKYRNKIGSIVLAMYGAASLLAVIPWNIGQEYGEKLGKYAGMSNIKSNYLPSSFLAGTFEAVVQMAVITGVTCYLDPKEKSKWKIDSQHLLQRSIEFLLAIPSGAVWNIIFQAVLELTQESLVGGLVGTSALCGGVALTAILSAKLAEKITTLIEKKCNATPSPSRGLAIA